jgi:hypothetical protein
MLMQQSVLENSKLAIGKPLSENSGNNTPKKPSVSGSVFCNQIDGLSTVSNQKKWYSNIFRDYRVNRASLVCIGSLAASKGVIKAPSAAPNEAPIIADETTDCSLTLANGLAKCLAPIKAIDDMICGDNPFHKLECKDKRRIVAMGD